MYSDIVHSHLWIAALNSLLYFRTSGVFFVLTDVFKSLSSVIYKFFVVIYEVLHLIVGNISTLIESYKLCSEHCVYLLKFFVCLRYGWTRERYIRNTWDILKCKYFWTCLYFEHFSQKTFFCIYRRNAWNEYKAAYNDEGYCFHKKYFY